MTSTENYQEALLVRNGILDVVLLSVFGDKPDDIQTIVIFSFPDKEDHMFPIIENQKYILVHYYYEWKAP